METIVNSVAAKYLSLFVKDYHKRQLQLSISGRGGIKNVELREEVVQEILCKAGLPFLGVAKAVIDNVEVKAPLTSLGKEPVTVSVSNVLIDVFEHRQPKATTHIIDQFMAAPAAGDEPAATQAQAQAQAPKKGGKAPKYGFGHRIGDGVSISVECISIRVRALGMYRLVPGDGPWTPPGFRLELRHISVYTTNSSWEVVPLNKALPKYEKGVPEVLVFKYGTIKSISLSLACDPQREDYSTEFVSDLGLKLKIIMSKKSIGGGLTGIKIQAVMDNIEQELKASSIPSLLAFVSALALCMGRTDKPTAEEQAEADHLTLQAFKEAQETRKKVEEEQREAEKKKQQQAPDAPEEEDGEDDGVSSSAVSDDTVAGQPLAPAVNVAFSIPSIRFSLAICPTQTVQLFIQKVNTFIAIPEIATSPLVVSVSVGYLSAMTTETAAAVPSGSKFRFLEPLTRQTAFPDSTVISLLAGSRTSVTEMIPIRELDSPSAASAPGDAAATLAADAASKPLSYASAYAYSNASSLDGAKEAPVQDNVARVRIVIQRDDATLQLSGAKMEVAVVVHPLQVRVRPMTMKILQGLAEAMKVPPFALPEGSQLVYPPVTNPLNGIALDVNLLGICASLAFENHGYILVPVAGIRVTIHPRQGPVMHFRELKGKASATDLFRDVLWNFYRERICVHLEDVGVRYFRPGWIAQHHLLEPMDIFLNVGLNLPYLDRGEPPLLHAVVSTLKVNATKNVVHALLADLGSLAEPNQSVASPEAAAAAAVAVTTSAASGADGPSGGGGAADSASGPLDAVKESVVEDILRAVPQFHVLALVYSLSLNSADHSLPALRLSDVGLYADLSMVATLDRERGKDPRAASFPIRLVSTQRLDLVTPVQRAASLSISLAPVASSATAVEAPDMVSPAVVLRSIDQLLRDMAYLSSTKGLEFIRSTVSFSDAASADLADVSETAVLQLLKSPTLWATFQKQGFVQKQGGVHKSWNRRFFRLCGNYLFYFKSMDNALSLAKEPYGVLMLRHDSEVTEVVDPKSVGLKQGVFPYVVHSANRAMLCYTTSELERSEWMSAIRANIEKSKEAQARLTVDEKRQYVSLVAERVLSAQQLLLDLKSRLLTLAASAKEVDGGHGLENPALADAVTLQMLARRRDVPVSRPILEDDTGDLSGLFRRIDIAPSKEPPAGGSKSLNAFSEKSKELLVAASVSADAGSAEDGYLRALRSFSQEELVKLVGMCSKMLAEQDVRIALLESAAAAVRDEE